MYVIANWKGKVLKSSNKNVFISKIRLLSSRNPVLGTLVIFILVIIAFTIFSPIKNSFPVFISGENIKNILEQTAGISIAAFGMTLVLLVGGIDLSVGSLLALISVVSANLLEKYNFSIVLTVLICLCIGFTVGLLNGLIITRFRVQPFLVTLGTLSIVKGLAYVISQGESVYISNRMFGQIFVHGSILMIPVSVLWTIIFLFIMFILVSKTKFGRRVQAVGGNELAAITSGVNVKSIKVFSYVICGGVSAFSGMILVSRLGTGMPSVGAGFELNVIAAVVLGGTGFSGEGGNMFGTLLGSLVIGTIMNGLTILGVSSYIQDVIKGAVIILTIVSSSILIARREER